MNGGGIGRVTGPAGGGLSVGPNGNRAGGGRPYGRWFSNGGLKK